MLSHSCDHLGVHRIECWNPVELVSVKLGNRLHCFWIETWTHWCNFLFFWCEMVLHLVHHLPLFDTVVQFFVVSFTIYAIACVLWFHSEIKIWLRQWFFAWVLSSFFSPSSHLWSSSLSYVWLFWCLAVWKWFQGFVLIGPFSTAKKSAKKPPKKTVRACFWVPLPCF